MKSVRLISTILHYLSRILSVLVLLVITYALVVVVLHQVYPSAALPIRILENETFQILFPFSNSVFLLGDYTASYLVTNLMIISFYGLFLWLLADVFHAFKQPRLFTQKGVMRLARFYIANLVVPIIFIFLLAALGNELIDMVRITLLHFVIGVFAFFMAAIFRQGLVLQEEQDLTL